MPVTIIAELGSNADGSLGQAMALAKAAVGAGADIVKLQDHRWQAIPEDAKHPPWMPEQAVAVESRADYICRTCLDAREWKMLSSYVRLEFGAKFMASPFSVQALEWHIEHGTLDAIKIASGMVTNRPLLELARDSGLPVYLSSGMTSRQETYDAFELLTDVLVDKDAWRRTVPMHCTSSYPCRAQDVGLDGVSFLRREFRAYQIGYSDHTLGPVASLAAVTLGATAVERHVGWDRRAYGSDARHSMTIDEFAAFVVQVRELERMLAGKSKDEIVKGLGETRRQFLHGAT